MKKAYIACGGTGGHLSPGIALAEELLSRGWECRLLISNKQVDSRLVEKYEDFNYETLSGSGMSLNPVRLLKFILNLVKGTASCYSKFRREKPDLVIGFGGFLSMPVLLAGKLSGVPTAIHEANRVAGRVTRISSSFVKRIFLPMGVTVKTTRSARIRFVGMPVRKEIYQKDKPTSKESLGFDSEKRLLVVMGGSQGAESLNQWVVDRIEELAKLDVQVLCLTGGSSAVVEGTRESGNVRFVFKQFSDDMAVVLSAADLVVSRSGAGSIAEFIRCRAPAILIPYPFSADEHQVANARDFEQLGCGVKMDQEFLDELLDEVSDVICNDVLLGKYQAALERANLTSAQSFIADDLERLLKEGTR